MIGATLHRCAVQRRRGPRGSCCRQHAEAAAVNTRMALARRAKADVNRIRAPLFVNVTGVIEFTTELCCEKSGSRSWGAIVHAGCRS